MIDFLSGLMELFPSLIRGVTGFVSGIGSLFSTMSEFVLEFSGFFPTYIIFLMQAIFLTGIAVITINVGLKIVNVITLGFGG